jgi:hypothetical protein
VREQPVIVGSKAIALGLTVCVPQPARIKALIATETTVAAKHSNARTSESSRLGTPQR